MMLISWFTQVYYDDDDDDDVTALDLTFPFYVRLYIF